MIIGEGISLSFGKNTVFHQFDFRIEERENVCISAESGKGKTTLLKMLQAYQIPDVGYIKVGGVTLTSATVHNVRAQMVWIPQNVNFQVDNGYGLIDLLLAMPYIDQIMANLKQLGLANNVLYQSFKSVSGGQKQRILIAICLSLPANIVLMDEPTSSLDEESIRKLIQFIKKQTDKTIVSTSHNLTWQQSVDRIIEL